MLDCGILPQDKREMENSAISRNRRDTTGSFRSTSSILEADLTLPPAEAQWPPPDLPNSKKFDGLVTYIDDEGQLYVQTEAQVESMEKVTREIGEMLAKNRQSTALDNYWKKGELCLARYPDGHIKGAWYRGVVTEVGEAVRTGGGGTVAEVCVHVLLVDYGEVKMLYPSKGELQKVVPRPLLEVPIQVS